MTETNQPHALCSRCQTPLSISTNRKKVVVSCPSCNAVFVDYSSEVILETIPEFLLRYERGQQELRQQVQDALAAVHDLAQKLPVA